MADIFSSNAPSLTSPPSRGFAVTPHNTNGFAQTTRAISVNASGNVAVVLEDGTVLTVYMVAGAPFPIRAIRVNATNTVATGIIGWF